MQNYFQSRLNKLTYFSNRKFARTIPRDFGVRYNPYTQSIDILDSAKQITNMLNEVHQEMDLLLGAMDKLHT